MHEVRVMCSYATFIKHLSYIVGNKNLKIAQINKQFPGRSQVTPCSSVGRAIDCRGLSYVCLSYQSVTGSIPVGEILSLLYLVTYNAFAGYNRELQISDKLYVPSSRSLASFSSLGIHWFYSCYAYI